MKNELSQEELKSILMYVPDTGFFYRHGRLAGGPDKTSGYWRIRVNKHIYQSHRLAWLYVHGYFPKVDIDHINRQRSDNRIANLREATRSENKRNGDVYKTNTLGIKGVHMVRGKYRATYWDGEKRKPVHLGYFGTAAEAKAAHTAHYSHF